jgi:hypothetical protein
MNLRELSCLERAGHWLEELITACRWGGALDCHNHALASNVLHKARALHTSLAKLRASLTAISEEAQPPAGPPGRSHLHR